MKLRDTTLEGFVAGMTVGLIAAGVTIFAVGAARRARMRSATRRAAMRADAHHEIDGVRPESAVELAAQPMREANMFPRRLESERLDPAPRSQRW